MKKLFVFFLIIPISAFAEYITNDIIAGCDSSVLNTSNNITNMFPMFAPNTHTCSSGQFLPAYTDNCETCPSGYVCNGGTYIFNEHESQGIEQKQYITQSTQYTCSSNFLNSVNNITNMVPVFTPNIITLNWNDGTNITTTQCAFGETITIPNPPTRPGYKFGGWRVKRRN